MKSLRFVNILLLILPYAYIVYNAEKIKDVVQYKWSVLTPYQIEGTISFLFYFITAMVLFVAVLVRYTKERNKKETNEEKKKKRKWRQHILTFEILFMTSLYAHKIVQDNINEYGTKMEFMLLITVGIIFLTVVYDIKKEGTENAKKRLHI